MQQETVGGAKPKASKKVVSGNAMPGVMLNIGIAELVAAAALSFFHIQTATPFMTGGWFYIDMGIMAFIWLVGLMIARSVYPEKPSKQEGAFITDSAYTGAMFYGLLAWGAFGGLASLAWGV